MTDETEESYDVTGSAPVPDLKRWLIIYFKGMAMGAADTVPGVSGGTIALITGIYERLVTAIADIDLTLIDEFFGVYHSAGRHQFLANLRRRDVPFLVILGLGMLTAVVVLSRLVHAALVGYRVATFAFFFGLIAASTVVLYRELSGHTLDVVLASLVGFVVAFVVSGVSSSGDVSHALPMIFLTATVAITAMILPGVSGSFLLLLFGQYEYLTGTLTRFVDGLLAMAIGGDTQGLVEGAVVVTVFCSGAVVGLLSVANVIRWALSSYRRATFAFLVSLMAGSLRLPVREIFANVESWTVTNGTSVCLWIFIGAAAVLVLDHYTSDLEL